MYGYTLASIHSMFETNFIQKEAGASLSMTYQSFFIGLYSPNQTQNYWVWTDGSSYDFWNWLPGEGDPMGSKWCVEMRISDGKWQTASCYSTIPFLCSGPPGNPGNVTLNPTTTQFRTTTPTPRVTTVTTTNLMTTTEKHNCPRNWGFYPPTYDCYLLKPYYTFTNPENQYCNGTIRSSAENNYVRDFAAGFFAGLQVCFTGSTDNEMYLIGKAGIIGGARLWSDGEPMDYQPTTGCSPPNLPYNNFTPVIGVVDYRTQNVCWFAIADTSYLSLPSNCQYFLCKMDGH